MATVNAAIGATVTNVATIAAPAGVTELDPADNVDSDSNLVVGDLVFRDSFENEPNAMQSGQERD